MNLPSEKIESAKHGETVRFMEDNVEFVALRADLYDRMKNRPYDDSDWTEDEMEALAEQMFDEIDDPEPISEPLCEP